MSAASPAQPQVRRSSAPATSRAPAAQPECPVRQTFDFSKPRGEDEIRVNLADVPVAPASVDVAVFEPTLLSRLFDLFGPRR
ncbi:hypothetical protein JM946_02190 [Steroidobacter sp. S1-65]|uniref:Uncharacterized protein n=1 Tax=Steroidobacter gossypii TaxID=2805490 RepID=A0ABS1WRD1_9GAMM|nr:hypothetical protein [Steroidobacter gossypii]MBM0103530.1 hypothetical protein [Steroidobacter gossypii]